MHIPDDSSVTIHLADVKDGQIRIGNNARVNLIGEINEDKKLEIVVGENAELTSCIVQRNGSLEQKNTARKHARIHTAVVYFGSGHSTVTNALEGDHSEAYDVEIFVLDDEKKLTVATLLQQIGKNTRGNIFVRGIARDHALAKLDGMIEIGKNGKNANSFLDQHVLLLNPGARADARPQLEIKNNDVQSSHSASVGQIKEEKIFYLESRGIPRSAARALLVHGFLGSAVQKIRDDAHRVRIAQLLLSTDHL
ncbi:MAG TPA: SufD family Fe-S cluster assembly protein [Candidatus Bilamarchaeaceae archaeon]|nr:SufD family Fe-S cluster assembly protein [Candidatus Bilamarchaeaceae archaeon]